MTIQGFTKVQLIMMKKAVVTDLWGSFVVVFVCLNLQWSLVWKSFRMKMKWRQKPGLFSLSAPTTTMRDCPLLAEGQLYFPSVTCAWMFLVLRYFHKRTNSILNIFFIDTSLKKKNSSKSVRSNLELSHIFLVCLPFSNTCPLLWADKVNHMLAHIQIVFD